MQVLPPQDGKIGGRRGAAAVVQGTRVGERVGVESTVNSAPAGLVEAVLPAHARQVGQPMCEQGRSEVVVAVVADSQYIPEAGDKSLHEGGCVHQRSPARWSSSLSIRFCQAATVKSVTGRMSAGLHRRAWVGYIRQRWMNCLVASSPVTAGSVVR